VSNPIALVIILGMVAILYLAMVGVIAVREWWRQKEL
jgi:hypothetical protein